MEDGILQIDFQVDVEAAPTSEMAVSVGLGVTLPAGSQQPPGAIRTNPTHRQGSCVDPGYENADPDMDL
jgi:hypothetical protein